MLGHLAALSAALLIPIVDGAPQSAPNALVAFFRAADVNDFSAMNAILDPRSADFTKSISNCYLRRVYADQVGRRVIASWMCSEGPDRSRVVLATVSPTSVGTVSVSDIHEVKNNIPAPQRAGSAFTE